LAAAARDTHKSCCPKDGKRGGRPAALSRFTTAAARHTRPEDWLFHTRPEDWLFDDATSPSGFATAAARGREISVSLGWGALRRLVAAARSGSLLRNAMMQLCGGFELKELIVRAEDVEEESGD
jgi:hypothetical protein